MDGNPITAQAPWQVQQFVRGEEFSAFAVVRRGQLQVLTVCESSPSQLNYRHVDVPAIEAWVRRQRGRAVGQFRRGTGLHSIRVLGYVVELLLDPRGSVL